MPRELVTLQVGQCGNQIGCKFWELALREHARYNKTGCFDEALSSFFQNVDTTQSPPRSIAVGNGKQPIQTLKARCVMIDMEEGVVSEILKGPLSEIFDHRQLLTDVSGSGNNFAHGHNFYGPKYRASILEKIRLTVEECDSLQGFFLLHSLGGGTGSGLGSFVMELVEDEFPGAHRFALSVFPSEDDDVITSPYNALLSVARLTEHADCVLPVENQALMDMCKLMDKKGIKDGKNKAIGQIKKGSKPFDAYNRVAASLILNLTSSVRFEGSLNVDLNEIGVNLVPYPRMQFLLSSMSPLIAPKDIAKHSQAPRALDQIFREVFSRDHQLAKCDPLHGTYLACGLLFRGVATMTDINRNIEKMRPNMTVPSWNTEGFKIGLTAHPPIGVPFSVLALSNNTCIKSMFRCMQDRFQKLYRGRYYVHHYAEYMDVNEFEVANGIMSNLINDYSRFDREDVVEDWHRTRLMPVGMKFS